MCVGADYSSPAWASLRRGAVWNLLPAHPPFACPLLTATGIPCPFCGMTRAVVAAMHGDVLGSLAFNPAGLLVIALAIFVIARARLPVTRIPIGIVIGVLRRALGLERRVQPARSDPARRPRPIRTGVSGRELFPVAHAS